MKLRPMLMVADVRASAGWYEAVLGLRAGHGGDEFEMLYEGDDYLLQLHRLDAHEHGFAALGEGARRGAGVSLWFEVADRAAVEAAVARARGRGTPVVAGPAWNPLAHHHEATLQDPDGYTVAVCTPFSMEE